jgi:hypothetical protein
MKTEAPETHLVSAIVLWMSSFKIALILGIAIAIALVVILIAKFAREVPKQITPELWKIVKLFYSFGSQVVSFLIEFGSLIGKFLFSLWSLVWIVWCHIFAARWKIRFYSRYAFVRFTLGALLVGSFYVIAELTLALAHRVVAAIPEIGATIHELAVAHPKFANVTQAIIRAYPKLITSILHIHELPLWIDILLVILAVMVSVHHFREFKISLRQKETPVR